MSSDVVLSAALRSNLLSLQNTQRLIDTTQLRLATGLKVNSALDNPQNFFASQSLKNRAGDLSRLLDGIGQSIRTIEEADKGISALTKLLEQASSIAESAQSEVLAAEGFASITATADVGQFDDLVADSNGAIANGDDIRFSFFEENTNGGAIINVNVNIANGDTIYDIVGTINSTAAINEYARASVDSAGRLKFESLVEGGLIRIGDDSGGTTIGADGYAFLGLDGLVTTEQTVATTRQGGTAVAGRVLASAEHANFGTATAIAASDTLATAGYSNAFAIAGGDDFSITLRVDDQTVALGANYGDATTIQEVIDDINAEDLDVVASFNLDTGRIELAYGDDVGTAEITFVAGAAGAGDHTFGFGTGVSDVTGTAATNQTGEAFSFIGSSANLVQFRDDFNTIRDQIDDLVGDASYRGVNLLNGDNLTTFFNEDRSSRLVTQGQNLDSLGLGINEAEFLTGSDVTAAINEVRNATDTVRNFGSTIANSLAVIQTRRDFTEGTIKTLQAGADDLTLADQNEEGANLLALQTRQQLGVTSLSLAAQSQQSVLRLF